MTLSVVLAAVAISLEEDCRNAGRTGGGGGKRVISKVDCFCNDHFNGHGSGSFLDLGNLGRFFPLGCRVRYYHCP